MSTVKYELYMGLPLRTLEAEDKEGNTLIFGVTTEMVNDLVVDAFGMGTNLKYEEFDSSYSYAVPSFLLEYGYDKDLIAYIHHNIDDNFKL